jgi:hypothetical protein
MLDDLGLRATKGIVAVDGLQDVNGIGNQGGLRRESGRYRLIADRDRAGTSRTGLKCEQEQSAG